MTKLIAIEKGIRKTVFTSLWKALDVESVEDLAFIGKVGAAVVSGIAFLYGVCFFFG